jgi:hypothetical protein
MCSGGNTSELPLVGFPIRKSPGHSLLSSSPRLIAAGHVLHRRPMPRHPSCALHSLNMKRNTNLPIGKNRERRIDGKPPARRSQPLCGFQGSTRAGPHEAVHHAPGPSGPSSNEQVTMSSVDIPRRWRAEARSSTRPRVRRGLSLERR